MNHVNIEEKKVEDIDVEERFAYLSDEESDYEDMDDGEWSLTNKTDVKPSTRERLARKDVTGYLSYSYMLQP